MAKKKQNFGKNLKINFTSKCILVSARLFLTMDISYLLSSAV